MQLTADIMHPQRFALTNELHARPFQPLEAPGRILHIAFKQPLNAAERDKQADVEHLIAFLDRHGGPHPAEDAGHYTHDFGRFLLKWEQHTEFVSYTLYTNEPADELFAHRLGDLLDQAWVAEAPGKVISAIEIELVTTEGEEAALSLINNRLARKFNSEGLAVSHILDNAGMALGDFRIHEGGFIRFAIVVHRETGRRRIGRAVQRLLEIETYKTLSLLALPIARKTAARLNQIELELTDLVAKVSSADGTDAAEILTRLSALSAEIEALSASAAFRFGAAGAYAKIVHDRIEMLREERVAGRQLFREFMLRRFEPAMQTCHSARGRLEALSTRASRIAELLRTRVDVEMEAQNQKLLRSMDQRAGMQLRLQHTVESISVVAISYYAVSLAAYILAPFAPSVGLTKPMLTALIAVPIIACTWVLSRMVRKKLEKDD
ncbi:DUF3422 domain-containing protein [Rhodobacteraceae bacterium NNCM2]|nr:DUF3422 domain-containing protein [Coraliihabitans acroporae]